MKFIHLALCTCTIIGAFVTWECGFGFKYAAFTDLLITMFLKQKLLHQEWLGKTMCVCSGRSSQIFQKSMSHLKILGARRATWSKFHTQGPQILGATIQNLVDTVTRHLGFVHPVCGRGCVSVHACIYIYIFCPEFYIIFPLMCSHCSMSLLYLVFCITDFNPWNSITFPHAGTQAFSEHNCKFSIFSIPCIIIRLF